LFEKDDGAEDWQKEDQNSVNHTVFNWHAYVAPAAEQSVGR